RHESGVRAGRATHPRDFRAARIGAPSGEDEANRPFARGCGVRFSRLSLTQTHEWSAVGTATPTGVLPAALAVSPRNAPASPAREGVYLSWLLSSGPARDHHAA